MGSTILISFCVFVFVLSMFGIFGKRDNGTTKQPTFNDEESKPIYDEMCNLLKNNTILTKEQDILLSAKVICIGDTHDRVILDGLLNVLKKRTQSNNNEPNINDNKTYWEDLDLLAEIEKLETKEAVGVFDYPFYKQFQEDVFYETKNLFPKTKKDLEEKGYFDIREEKGHQQKDWIEELKCFRVVLRGFKKVGKYKVRVDFDITRNRIYPIYASDEETKKPSPKIYYFDELEEKIDEICSLANVTTNKDGLNDYSFGRMMSPNIEIIFREYWNAPQTRKDFQKLGCTSIEYSNKRWNCYKQIGNKILSLYFDKEYHHNNIFSIREIDLTQHEEQPKQVENEDKQSSVYLLFSPLNNTYKIGKANDVDKRLKALQTGNPDIQLITYKTYASEKQAFQMESMLHKQYQDNNYKKEWFNLNEEDVEFIKQTLS